MRALPLVKKEVKELSKERVVLFGMIIGPIVIFGLLGLFMSYATGSVEKEASKPFTAALMSLDDSPEARGLIDALKREANITLTPPGDPVETLKKLSTRDVKILIVIPPGFGENLSKGMPGIVEEYVYIDATGLALLGKLGRLSSTLKLYGENLVLDTVRRVYPNASLSFVTTPISEQTRALLFGKPVKGTAQEAVGKLTMQMAVLPMIILVAGISAIQVAGISVALEKESKTLEMLLTLPVSRNTVLASKLAGISVVSLLGAASYTAGFILYMRGLASTGAPMPSLSPGGLAAYFAVLFLGLLVSAAIGILASVFVGDVRSAQVMGSYLGLPLMAPFFLLFFGMTPEALSPAARLVLLLDPYTYLMKAFLGILSGDAASVALGVLGLSAYSVALLYIASLLFNSERILTARIRLGRRRG